MDLGGLSDPYVKIALMSNGKLFSFLFRNTLEVEVNKRIRNVLTIPMQFSLKSEKIQRKYYFELRRVAGNWATIFVHFSLMFFVFKYSFLRSFFRDLSCLSRHLPNPDPDMLHEISCFSVVRFSLLSAFRTFRIPWRAVWNALPHSYHEEHDSCEQHIPFVTFWCREYIKDWNQVDLTNDVLVFLTILFFLIIIPVRFFNWQQNRQKTEEEENIGQEMHLESVLQRVIPIWSSLWSNQQSIHQSGGHWLR